MATKLIANIIGAETQQIAIVIGILTQATVRLAPDVEIVWKFGEANASKLTIDIIVPESIADKAIKALEKKLVNVLKHVGPHYKFKDFSISVYKRGGTGTIIVSGIEGSFPNVRTEIEAAVEEIFGTSVTFHQVGGTRKRLEKTTIVVILPPGFSETDAEKLQKKLETTLPNVIVAVEEIK